MSFIAINAVIDVIVKLPFPSSVGQGPMQDDIDFGEHGVIGGAASNILPNDSDHDHDTTEMVDYEISPSHSTSEYNDEGINGLSYV